MIYFLQETLKHVRYFLYFKLFFLLIALESKDWKSSLNVDKILSMKTVQQHLNRAQVCGIRAPDKVHIFIPIMLIS